MVLGPHLVCGTKNANDMGMVLSKHWRYSTWCSCITGHFIQAKLWYNPWCNWRHPSFGQSPMVWNSHCRDSASISSGGLQLCIFPCSWLQWDCDSRIYLLYLLLKFGLWYVVVLSNLTTFAQGYASFASLELMPWLNHPVAASSDAPRGVGFPNFEFHHCGLPRKPKVGKVYGPWGDSVQGRNGSSKFISLQLPAKAKDSMPISTSSQRETAEIKQGDQNRVSFERRKTNTTRSCWAEG